MATVSEYLNGIPARRWRIIALRIEATEDQILESPALTLAICANEKHRAETGRDDYPRFLDMGLSDLNNYLAEDLAATEAAEDGAGEVTDENPFRDAAGGVGVATEQGGVLHGDPVSVV